MTDRVSVVLLAQRLEREGKQGVVPFSAELILAANLLLELQAKLDTYEGTTPTPDPQ